MKIGVIADTHGLMRTEALDALSDSDLIIHAGDVGKLEVITALQSIAQVVVIKGNIDQGETDHLPDIEVVEAGGLKIYVLHDLNELDIDPVQQGYDIIISGHSHKPAVTKKGGVLYLNPGAAGRRRFKLPISVATLWLEKGRPVAKIIELDV